VVGRAVKDAVAVAGNGKITEVGSQRQVSAARGSAGPSTPTLAAVVPATDSPAFLPRIERAIRDALDPPEETIVVTDPPYSSPASARNAGAERATADILVFIDSDLEVDRDVFRRIRAAFWVDPELTALFGSYDDGPEHPGTVSAFRNLLHHHVHRSQFGPKSTFWSGLGAVRREAFLAVGGFDADRYPSPSIEDIDLGRRLMARSARIDLDPRVRGTHLKHWTLAQMVKTDIWRRGTPWVNMMLRERSLSSALNLSARHRASTAACFAGVLALLTRRLRLARWAFLTVLALNHSLYALLWRNLGAPRAVAGVCLHVIHLMSGVAAVPPGVISYFLERRRDNRRRPGS
jgi:GT2 family glycosyltransferase